MVPSASMCDWIKALNLEYYKQEYLNQCILLLCGGLFVT